MTHNKVIKEVNVKRIAKSLEDLGNIQLAYFDKEDRDKIIDAYKLLENVYKNNS